MRVLDLFCGAAGGWSLGLHRAGYRTVAAAESAAWRRAAFLHNNPGVEMFDDVRAVTADALRGRLGYLPEIVVGSPPCQDISAANHRACGVDGERSGLFFEALRIIGEIRPVWFALENSPRLRTLGYDRLADDMERKGYAVWPLVVGADDVLSPHQRDRVWLVGYDPDANGQGQPSRAVDGEMARMVGAARHTYRERLAIGQGIARNACAKLAAIVRAVGPIGAAFGAGPAGHFRMADGVPDRVARECIAAYGESVLPQIPEAIGRVMARLVPMELAA